ncbi:hypothetical protein RHO13_11105 [Orbus wheelerorum]
MQNKTLMLILSLLGGMGGVIIAMVIYSLFLVSNNTEQTALYYLLAIG